MRSQLSWLSASAAVSDFDTCGMSPLYSLSEGATAYTEKVQTFCIPESTASWLPRDRICTLRMRQVSDQQQGSRPRVTTLAISVSWGVSSINMLHGRIIFSTMWKRERSGVLQLLYKYTRFTVLSLPGSCVPPLDLSTQCGVLVPW